jgi:hypothetical protein
MTTKMCDELRAELARLGWNPAQVERYMNWGRRVSGSPSSIELERNGKTHSFGDPCVVVHGGGQAAIVRMG